MYHSIKSILLSLKKNRFFYSVNLFGFLAGFLVVTIIFTYVFQELSFDNFHKNSKDIYRIHSGGYGVTPACFAEKLKNQIPEVNEVIRFKFEDLTIVHQNQEMHIGRTYYTDPGIFNVFSFELLSGKTHEVLSEPYSIVINESTANKLFGTCSVIGELIKDKDGKTYTITAVMKDIPFDSHLQTNAFISMETLRHSGKSDQFNCSEWQLLTYVFLTEKANPKQVEVKLNELLADFKMKTDDGKFQLKLQPLKKIYFDGQNNKFDGCKHGNEQSVIMYIGISVLILLIVIINYINLSTAIAGGKMKEIAIRKIIGAQPYHIILSVLTEALGTVLFSFLIAILLIEYSLPQLCDLLNISISDSFNRSLLYFYYFIGVLIIGFITGFIPGLTLSRINELKSLKNESFLSSRGTQRKVLLFIQLLIVAVFLNSTFIINKQIKFMLHKDLGFQYDNVVSFELDNTLIEKWDILKNELLQSPHVKGVSFSSGLIGDNLGGGVSEINGIRKLCKFFFVDPDYIDLYKITMKSGRNFSWDLNTDLENSCIINEATSKAFQFANPVGEKYGHRTIIGVVDDYNFTSLHNQIEPLVIFCENGGPVIQIKTSAENKKETLAFIQRSGKNISPEFVGDFSFLENKMKDLYKVELDLKNSFQAYSMITILIASLGLFGVFLFTLKKKTKEISIRKLFGARLMDTFRLLTREQILIVTFSNIMAVPITYLLMNNWLNNFQYRIEMGIIVFLKTFLLTIIFTLMTILFLIIKTYRISLIKSFQYE